MQFVWIRALPVGSPRRQAGDDAALEDQDQDDQGDRDDHRGGCRRSARDLPYALDQITGEWLP